MMHPWETNRWKLLILIIIMAWTFEMCFGTFGGLR
tara:strand:+ start:134 stop:238 length:105 start_codon:yes stop_codon:yes gene_type:complete